MGRFLLLLLLLPQQAPDQEQLVHRLGDADAAVRERTSQTLEAQGDGALPELNRALEDADPEIRIRAKILIDLRAQERRLAERMRTQRPDKLRLAEVPREYDYPPGGIVETEGLRFTLNRRPWAPEGKLLGTLFSTEIASSPGLEVEWTIASVRDDRELLLETCAYHSPKLVYVPGPAPSKGEVRIQGKRRWYCDVPMLLRNPSDGMSRRIGGYTVTVLWPIVRVRGDRPLPESVMDRVLRDADVTCTIKPECVDRRYFGFGQSFGSSSHCGSRGPRKLAWCGCVGKPSRQESTPEALASEAAAGDRFAQRYDLEAIEAIALTLHLPVEEPFVVTSPPLK